MFEDWPPTWKVEERQTDLELYRTKCPGEWPKYGPRWTTTKSVEFPICDSDRCIYGLDKSSCIISGMYLAHLKIIWKGETDPWRKDPMVKTTQDSKDLCEVLSMCGFLHSYIEKQARTTQGQSWQRWLKKAMAMSSCIPMANKTKFYYHICCNGSSVAALAQNVLLYCTCPAYVLTCADTVSTWWDDVGRMDGNRHCGVPLSHHTLVTWTLALQWQHREVHLGILAFNTFSVQ